MLGLLSTGKKDFAHKYSVSIAKLATNTMDSQGSSKPVFPCCIWCHTSVNARVAMGYMFNWQDTWPGTQFYSGDTHMMRYFLTVEVPSDFQRRVTVTHKTHNLSVLSWPDFSLKGKWSYSWWFCKSYFITFFQLSVRK